MSEKGSNTKQRPRSGTKHDDLSGPPPPLPSRPKIQESQQSIEIAAKTKLRNGEITEEEYEIITATHLRFRALSDAADKNLLGSELSNKKIKRSIDPFAACPEVPEDSSILYSNSVVYCESSIGGFISVNDGYATLRTMDYAVPLILVHADQRKYNTPIREGDVVFLRWGRAWLRGHPTSSYMTFEEGETPSSIGQSAAFRVTDLVADRSGFQGTRLFPRQELTTDSEFGLASIYWKRCFIGAFTLNPSPTEPRYLLCSKPGSRKGVRPLPLRCVSKTFCDQRRVEHHTQRKEQLIHHGRRMLSSSSNATSNALRHVTAGPLGLPVGGSEKGRSFSPLSSSPSSTSPSSFSSASSTNKANIISNSGGGGGGSGGVVKNIDTGENVDVDDANATIQSKKSSLLHAMDKATRNSQLLETKQLLGTIHDGIASRIAQKKGEFETSLLPAMKSKIEAMNASRKMLMLERQKLEKSVSNDESVMVSDETLELYEQIESVIAQTHAGMDQAKTHMYFPECDGYRYRFGSTPIESKTGMTGGTFLGLHDFAIESFSAKYSIQVESYDGNVHIGVPRVIINITNVQISLILYGVHLLGEKKSGIPEFKRQRVVLDIEFSLDGEFQFRSADYTGPSTVGSKKKKKSRFGKMASGLGKMKKNVKKNVGKSMSKAKKSAENMKKGVGKGMSSMSKLGKGLSKKSLKGLSNMKLKMKDMRSILQQRKKKKNSSSGGSSSSSSSYSNSNNGEIKNSTIIDDNGDDNDNNGGNGEKGDNNSTKSSKSPEIPIFRRRKENGPQCNWEVERFSFKIDKINSLKGTPLPKRVIKMLLNNILPTQIKNILLSTLSEALGIYLSETPGQRCMLAGEISLQGTGLDVFDAKPGEHEQTINKARIAAENCANNMASTSLAKENKIAALKAVASGQALELLGGLDSKQAEILFNMSKNMNLQSNGIDDNETNLNWTSISDLLEYAMYIQDNSNNDSNNDEWELLLHAWQKAADAMCYSPMIPLSINKIFSNINLLRRKPLRCNIQQHIFDCRGDIAPAILMFRQSVEATMGRMIDEHGGGRRRRPSKYNQHKNKKTTTSDALAVRRATLALQKVHEWEKGMLLNIVAAKNTVKRLNGNVLISLRGGSRGIIDICGDQMNLQLPAGMNRRYEDMEWLKSPITNLIHVEKGGGGGRFYFDIVVEPDEIDDVDNTGQNDKKINIKNNEINNDETKETKETQVSSLSDIRQSSALSVQTNGTEGEDVLDAEGRLYDHDDHYLRILSLSFRRARTRWVMDRERMLQLLISDEDEHGNNSHSMDLWVADMALEGIDDHPNKNTSKKPLNPAYIFQTTWLPYSKLMFTVLDYRLLGPPWRVTQWMTGTLKNNFRDTTSNTNESKQDEENNKIKKEEEDAAAAEPFRIIMNTLQRYVRSPDLSMKCALSVSLDGGDDDDLSFFFDSDSDDDNVNNEEEDTINQLMGEQKNNVEGSSTNEDIVEEGDEASAPNIAFSLTNWVQGINYHPKRRKDDDDDDSINGKRKTRPKKQPSLLDGTMAEFNITFSIQDLLDDKASYDAAFAITEGDDDGRPTSPTYN